MKDNEYFIKEPWLKWAIEIQSIAQAGLYYGEGIFDKERYQQLRKISQEMLSYKTNLSDEKIENLFCNETGYQTPKIETRGALFKDNKILLVKERDNKWSLPGGWCDVMESVKSNTIKEMKEEAGLEVQASKIIAILDRNKHNTPILPYGVIKVFVLCEYISGEFQENIETSESNYFSLDNLPELSLDRVTYEQIKMCFDAKNSSNWEVVFD